MSALRNQTGAEPEAAGADAAASTAIAIAKVHETPVIVFTSPEHLEAIYAGMEKEVKEFVPDITTPTGRKKIASLAMKVAKVKTMLDAAGKELNVEKRAEIDAVDKIRRSMRDRFDTLSGLARQPLDDWESAETRRQEAVKRDLADLREAGMIFSDDTLEEIRTRLERIEATPIDAEIFREHATEAEGRRAQAIASLQAGIERLELQAQQALELEARNAELAQLRADKEERDRRDAARAEADRIQREEEARLAREKADRERAERDAIKQAQREAEKRAQDEREAQQRIIDAQEAEARRVAEAEKRAREEAVAAAAKREREIQEAHEAELKRIADEAAQKERDRLADLERDRIAREAEEERRQDEARKAREADDKRQADRKHRAKVKAEVVTSIIQLCDATGLTVLSRDQDLITAIVDSVADGKIAHTAIQF